MAAPIKMKSAKSTASPAAALDTPTDLSADAVKAIAKAINGVLADAFFHFAAQLDPGLGQGYTAFDQDMVFINLRDDAGEPYSRLDDGAFKAALGKAAARFTGAKAVVAGSGKVEARLVGNDWKGLPDGGTYRTLPSGGTQSSLVPVAGMFDGGTLTRKIKLTDVTDGLTNTVMVGEVLQGKSSDLRGFIWWGDAAGFSTFAPPNTATMDQIYTGGYCNSQPAQRKPNSRLSMVCSGGKFLIRPDGCLFFS